MLMSFKRYLVLLNKQYNESNSFKRAKKAIMFKKKRIKSY